MELKCVGLVERYWKTCDFENHSLTNMQLDQFPRRRNPDGLPATTMLEHIYILFRDKQPEVLSWTNNLEIMELAVCVDLNIVLSQYNIFKEKMDLLSSRIKASDDTQPSGRNFKAIMQPFYDHSTNDLQTLKSSLKKVGDALKEMREWFDVDGDDLEFLKQINSFRKNFKSIGKRLEDRAKEAERKAKKRQKTKSRKGDRRTMADALASGMAKRRKFMDGDHQNIAGAPTLPNRRESIMRVPRQRSLSNSLFVSLPLNLESVIIVIV